MNDLVTAIPLLRANDEVVAKEMAETLHAAYPGHLWGVTVNNGVADVRNLYFSGQWGFRLFVEQAHSASEFKRRVLRAGGELLERYRVSRGKFNESHYATMQTDFAGRHKADL